MRVAGRGDGGSLRGGDVTGRIVPEGGDDNRGAGDRWLRGEGGAVRTWATGRRPARPVHARSQVVTVSPRNRGDPGGRTGKKSNICMQGTYIFGNCMQPACIHFRSGTSPAAGVPFGSPGAIWETGLLELRISGAAGSALAGRERREESARCPAVPQGPSLAVRPAQRRMSSTPARRSAAPNTRPGPNGWYGTPRSANRSMTIAVMSCPLTTSATTVAAPSRGTSTMDTPR